MEQEIIINIENTSEEYRNSAGRLTDVLEYLLDTQRDPDQKDETVRAAAERLAEQIRELTGAAEAMQDIALNWRRIGTELSGLSIDFDTAARDGEFGISEFGSLSKHEALMPIHSS